jgi:transposase
VDGRADKPYVAEEYHDAIAAWFEDQAGQARPANVLALYEYLVHERNYPHSYKSVLRYVRAKFERPKIRTYRRVETPSGAQTQTDWGEFADVDIGDGPQRLHAFFMVLSHSRKPAVVWSLREDQVHWLSCHNGAYRRLGGIAAVNRIDNVKTAVARGAGAWGELTESYRTYARSVGFHIDACAPRQANAKGKVEAKVRLGRLRIDPGRERFDGMEHLQAWTDGRLAAWAKQARCPATGLSVESSWEKELADLAPLPILPEPFDVVVTRPVQRDCMVSFEGRSYAVPFLFVGRPVEVRGCAGRVQILADGKVVKQYPRHTPARVLVDADCYEGESDDRVQAPPPLGRMGRRLQEIYELPVEQRPVDLYAALAEVAR